MNFSKRCLALTIVIAMILELCMIPYNHVEAARGSQYLIKVNRKQCCVTVYEKDDNGEYSIPVRAMACSVGKNNATPKGNFSTKAKYRWHLMFFDVYAQYCTRITDHILFHSVCYNAQDSSKLRFRDYNKLGEPASHGCIRLSTGDAKWIYDHCGVGTTVKIYDGENPGPLGKPEPIRIKENAPQRFWDPTDPSKENPWRKVAPTIYVKKDRTLERGSNLNDLKNKVVARNYLNQKLKVSISGTYDLNSIGTYTVYFRAEDYLGNVTKKSVQVKIKDTKRPVIKLEKTKLVFYDKDIKKINEKELKKKILKYVKVTDNNQNLDSKYISLDLEILLDAMSNQQYGKYKVAINAVDKAGNEAKEKIITIYYKETEKETPED